MAEKREQCAIVSGMHVSIKTYLPLIIGTILIVAGFALATNYDVAISLALYDAENPLAIFLEVFGWVPGFVPVIVLFLLLGSDGKSHLLKRIASLLFALALSIFLGALSDGYLILRWHVSSLSLYLFPLLTLVLFIAFSANAKKLEPIRGKLIEVALAATILAIATVIIVNLIKLLWMRTRFDEMILLGDFSLFTPWYVPLGNGGSSFPSGHTAHAACMISLVFLSDAFRSWRKFRPALFAASFGYMGLMMASRIIIGRHFLSDTLASIVIVLALFIVIRKREQLRARISPLSP